MILLHFLNALALVIRAFVYTTALCYVAGKAFGNWARPIVAYHWEQREFYTNTLREWQVSVERQFTLDAAPCTA